MKEKFGDTPPQKGKEKKPRTADYLAPGDVIADSFVNIKCSPEKMKEFFRKYVASIRQEGIKKDPEKFAKEMFEGFLKDYEDKIEAWREIIAEKKLIDINQDPFAYNVDFDFNAWLKMRPTHISETEWPLRLAKLKLALESEMIKTEHDRQTVILGWKLKNGLLPKE